MTSMESLAVTVTTERARDTMSSGVAALLHEIASLLQSYLDSGKPGGVDLRSLPLTDADQRALSEELGIGEVTATVDALGKTMVRETGCCGVWWLKHCNSDGTVMAEIIEINTVPTILKASEAEMRSDLASLLQGINQPSEGSGSPVDGEGAS